MPIVDRHLAPIRVGDRVRCDRAQPARGTWPRFAGRVGRVAAIHREVLDGRRVHVELGISWSLSDARHGEVDCWCLPSELLVVGDRPPDAPESGAGDVDRPGTRALRIGDSGHLIAVGLDGLEAV
jgi:hypothetical protein